MVREENKLTRTQVIELLVERDMDLFNNEEARDWFECVLAKDHFVGQEKFCQVRDNYVRAHRSCYLSKWEGRAHYCSWYA